MTLQDHLMAMHQQHGMLTPTIVVTEARDPDHPLHQHFTWDDAVAAEMHRLEQARKLIRKVKVTFTSQEGEQRSVRGFVSVIHEPTGQRAYSPVEQVAEDPFLRRLVMADMRREWEALRRRYAAFDEFWQLVADAVEGEEETG